MSEISDIMEDLLKDPNPYKCDGSGCSQSKSPTNGWFLVIPGDKVLVPYGSSQKALSGLSIVPWDSDLADTNFVKHYCGIPCVLKAVGQELVKVYQTGDIEQP